MLKKNGKVFVAGHNGMVGSAVVRSLSRHGISNILTANRDELNLLDKKAVDDFLQREQPDYIVIAAAKVGGIEANNSYPADFLVENLMIETHLIDGAFKIDVDGLLFLGSSCIYPKLAPQPMSEESLLTGMLEPTNEPYAIAKIAGIKLCESYNRQHQTDYRSVMPTNLYGPNDNFNLNGSHVLPALMRKFHEAKTSGQRIAEVWGSGNALREFLHVDDMAEACVHVMTLEKATLDAIVSERLSHINVGTGKDCSIAELAETLRDVIGFDGELCFDSSKPDGTPRKLLDVSRLHQLGWQAEIDLQSGIRSTYEWFLANQDRYRR